jgi:RNA polymerase sigma-70 factor (ECF subfamily)
MDDEGGARIPQRHVTELSAFFAAHDRWLFGHACVRTRGDRELAADLAQDTFEAAARAWATLRGRAAGQQRAWLLGTLANKDVSDFRRKEALRRKQPDIQARYQATAADTAAQALNALALERAREIIEDMPPRQQKIALMRWRDRMKASEIAAELGVAEGTVHAQLHTARGKLVAGLEQYYPFGQDHADKEQDSDREQDGKKVQENEKEQDSTKEQDDDNGDGQDSGKGAAS